MHSYFTVCNICSREIREQNSIVLELSIESFSVNETIHTHHSEVVFETCGKCIEYDRVRAIIIKMIHNTFFTSRDTIELETSPSKSNWSLVCKVCEKETPEDEYISLSISNETIEYGEVNVVSHHESEEILRFCGKCIEYSRLRELIQNILDNTFQIRE